jgi:hypothetical protein
MHTRSLSLYRLFGLGLDLDDWLVMWVALSGLCRGYHLE